MKHLFLKFSNPSRIFAIATLVAGAFIFQTTAMAQVVTVTNWNNWCNYDITVNWICGPCGGGGAAVATVFNSVPGQVDIFTPPAFCTRPRVDRIDITELGSGIIYSLFPDPCGAYTPIGNVNYTDCAGWITNMTWNNTTGGMPPTGNYNVNIN